MSSKKRLAAFKIQNPTPVLSLIPPVRNFFKEENSQSKNDHKDQKSKDIQNLINVKKGAFLERVGRRDRDHSPYDEHNQTVNHIQNDRREHQEKTNQGDDDAWPTIVRHPRVRPPSEEKVERKETSPVVFGLRRAKLWLG